MRVSFLFADLLSSNPVPEGLPRTGVRDRRGLDWPELITVLVKVREKCCHRTDSYLYLLRERKRDRQKGRSTRLLQQQLAKPGLCQRACRRSCNIGRPRTEESSSDRSSTQAKSESVKHGDNGKSHGRHYFSPQQNGAKKSLNSVTVHL